VCCAQPTPLTHLKGGAPPAVADGLMGEGGTTGDGPAGDGTHRHGRAAGQPQGEQELLLGGGHGHGRAGWQAAGCVVRTLALVPHLACPPGNVRVSGCAAWHLHRSPVRGWGATAGLVTSRDIDMVKDRTTLLSEVMTTELITLNARASYDDAVALLKVRPSRGVMR
jgi:hypothetical protein